MGGTFSRELINASDPLDREHALLGGLEPDAFGAQQTNATRLVDLLNRAAAIPGGAYLYFPPGRYLIGRPATPDTQGEQSADILVPQNVTLKFASGAQLVPMGYARADGQRVNGAPDWAERSLPGLQRSEHFKVRIEVMGAIEAGIFPIFDAFVEDDLETMNFQEAGRILFQRDWVRAIYPEWWNAVPLVNEQVPSPARVRRTTVALQMALDAANNRRVHSFARPIRDRHASIPLRLVNDYAIDRPLRIGATRDQARGNDNPDVDAPANTFGLVIRGECGPATRRFGAALIKAAPGFTPEPVVAPVSAEVNAMLVLRTTVGVTLKNVVFDANERAERCVSLSAPGAGAAAQSHGFEGCEFRNARRSLVHVGGELTTIVQAMPGDVPGSRVEPPDSGSLDFSNLRFTRCRFQTDTEGRIGATAAEVMEADRAAMAAGRPPSVDERLPITELEYMPGYWRVGVLFRSSEGFGVEFHGCAFLGPANPMILGLGGRLSLQNCTFRTNTVPSDNEPSMMLHGGEPLLPDASLRRWNGTDFLMALGLPDLSGTSSSQPVGATSFTARNVESRSRQFLATFAPSPSLVTRGRIVASVTLIHLRHRSDFPDDGIRPAIYWGGPRLNNAALVLQGCVFGERRPGSDIAGGVYVTGGKSRLAPVLDLGARRLGPGGGEVLVTTGSRGIPAVLRLGDRR